MQHGAWLGAVPEPAPTAKKAKNPAPPPTKTRLQRLKDAAGDELFEPEMPDPGAAQYLLDHFWTVGPSQGDEAISSGELESYQRIMGIALSPWECRTLRRLSIDFINERQRATAHGCKSKWEDEGGQIDRIIVAQDTRAAIRALSEL